MDLTDQQVTRLANAIRSISHGESTEPTGLEMLSMAIAGEGLGNPLAGAVLEAAEQQRLGLRAVAGALHAVAEAIQTGTAAVAASVEGR